jgi:hypothetical protein
MARGRAQTAVSRYQHVRQRYVQTIDTLNTEGQRQLAEKLGRLDAYLGGAAGSTVMSTAGNGSWSGGSGYPGPSASDGPGDALNGATAVGLCPIAGAPREFAELPLDIIDDEGGVTGPESFQKGYSPDDLAWAFQALHEVVAPAMAEGMGADYFADRDRVEGRMGCRSYADTYSGFFGGDAIRVSQRPDGRWEVENGRHRIWVARRMGLDAVPGWVRS